jgi:hypothetical protein
LFRGIRALGRFALVPVLCLAVLSGLALAGRRRLALVALALGILEACGAPLSYGRYQPPGPAARWLAGKPGAVAYLPLGERDTELMLEGIAHFRPLLNGDSGFMPRPYTRAMELLNGPLTDDALRLLRSTSVGHVVSRRELPLPLIERLGEDRIFAVPGGETARVVERGTPCATRWAPEGLLLDLGGPRSLRRVVFEPSEEPWIEQPRISVSIDGLAWSEVPARASLADAVLSLMKDPERGLAEVQIPRQTARFVLVDRRLPARRGALSVAP